LKAGGNCGIGLFFHISYDVWGSGDRDCFTEGSVGNLEKGAVQNFSSYSFAFGRFLRGCSILPFGNHLERGILFLLMGEWNRQVKSFGKR